MQKVSRKQIHMAIDGEKADIERFIRLGYIKADVNGRIPTVFVVQVSPRRFDVGWNYQDKNLENGATVEMQAENLYTSDAIACK